MTYHNNFLSYSDGFDYSSTNDARNAFSNSILFLIRKSNHTYNTNNTTKNNTTFYC